MHPASCEIQVGHEALLGSVLVVVSAEQLQIAERSRYLLALLCLERGPAPEPFALEGTAASQDEALHDIDFYRELLVKVACKLHLKPHDHADPSGFGCDTGHVALSSLKEGLGAEPGLSDIIVIIIIIIIITILLD
ncbi:hypothetical protein WISP_50801 [Willisornis vidua]|uniref:Uncharacterized protein n=1 Tax=Willisornis vidua TaxID=1566151 RepID=A0ABQ9DI61_9PASS|nr:hypothetical protein WISP_50801 [Willisornis vidua]